MKKMKKVKFLIGTLAGMLILASCGGSSNDKAAEISASLEPGEKPENAVVKAVDINSSTLEWEGTKVTGSGHNGTIELKSGEIYMVDDQPVGGNFIIDMNGISVLDIEDPESNARLKGHLESDDFFSVATFPEATFQMANIKPIEGAAEGEANYTINGNLTIKEITHGISFPARISVSGDQVSAFADFDFDRAKYDVRFGSGSFFDDLGDNMIRDNVNLKVNLAAK